MRLVAVGVPVGLGALASGVSWQLALLLIGAAPLAARRLLTPFVADEHERRAARRARLAEARARVRPVSGARPRRGPCLWRNPTDRPRVSRKRRKPDALIWPR
jgi:hypothetical protein